METDVGKRKVLLYWLTIRGRLIIFQDSISRERKVSLFPGSSQCNLTRGHLHNFILNVIYILSPFLLSTVSNREILFHCSSPYAILKITRLWKVWNTKREDSKIKFWFFQALKFFLEGRNGKRNHIILCSDILNWLTVNALLK